MRGTRPPTTAPREAGSPERYRVERVKPARSHGREGASTAAEHVASDDTYPCDHKVTYGTADDHIARLKRDAETAGGQPERCANGW